MSRRLLLQRFAVLALSATTLLLAGCGPQQDIRAAYSRLNEASRSRDGAGVAELTAQPTFDYFDRLLSLALKGSEATIRALPPAQKAHVLLMRNRCSLKELKNMDGRAWVVHAFNHHFYGAEPGEEPPYSVGRIQAGRTTARAEILFRGEPTGHDWRFYFVDGIWKTDTSCLEPVMNELYELLSSASQQPIDQVILDLEEEDFGKLTRDLWRPLERGG